VSDLPAPPHAYRGSAILDGVLALVVFVVAATSGGNVAKAVLVAIAYFVVATGWSWFRYRRRRPRATGSPDAAGNGRRHS